MRYMKKPIMVDAFQLGVDSMPGWFSETEARGIVKICSNGAPADIETLEGVMHASDGDFIIRGVNGEIYPCKPDIFEKTYEQNEGKLK